MTDRHRRRDVHQLWQHHPGCPRPDPAGIIEHEPAVGRPTLLHNGVSVAIHTAHDLSHSFAVLFRLAFFLVGFGGRTGSFKPHLWVVASWNGAARGTWLRGLRCNWGLAMLELMLTRMESTTDNRATQARG